MAEPVDTDTTPVPRGSVSRPVADSPSVEKERYDLEQDRETKRGQLSMRLVTLLTVLTISPLALALFAGLCGRTVAVSEYVGSCGGIPTMILKDYMTLVFTPIVTLVSAAMGFYFGEKSGENKNKTGG